MNAKEVRDLTGKERLEKMDDLGRENFNLKFQLATGKMEAPGRLKSIRRDIARLKTVIRESDLVGPAKESADKA
ncbi:MAG TPA: 50S ribosomal protein L29 [Rhodospirillales bacterium]|nr:50S ribosomal protein L29 [Rhodospirillales bacterium]